jgi:chemotaxis protein methyltransferase CheR
METRELELDLLLEAVFQQRGYDFRLHHREVLHARLLAVRQAHGLATLTALLDRTLHDPAVATAVLRGLAVPPAPLFDDPEQARMLRIVLSSLRASATPRVWLAECGSVETAWSAAILLAEESLLGRTEIFATMANEELVAEAAHASFSHERLAEYQEAYLKSGGKGNITRYFDRQGKNAVLMPELRERITWAHYNPVTDASFNEFQLIMTGRALPDYGPVLRQRVLQLCHDSLCRFGVLGVDRPLDAADTIAAAYQAVFPGQAWYKRVA